MFVQAVVREKYTSTRHKIEFSVNDKASTFDQLRNLSQGDRANVLFETLGITDQASRRLLAEDEEMSVFFGSLFFWLTESLGSGSAVNEMELSAVVASIAIWCASKSLAANEQLNQKLLEKVCYFKNYSNKSLSLMLLGNSVQFSLNYLHIELDSASASGLHLEATPR